MGGRGKWEISQEEKVRNCFSGKIIQPARAAQFFFIVLIVYTLSLSPFVILVKVHFAAKINLLKRVDNKNGK